MAKRFKSLQIRYKFLISFSALVCITMLICSVVIYLFVRKNIETAIENELNTTTQMILNMVKTSATASIRNYLRAVAEKNREIVNDVYQTALASNLTMIKAKEKATKILLSQTIGTSGYIYCVDSNGTVVVHPKSALIQSNVAHHDFVSKQMTSPQGYLEYEWMNPGETDPRPKALYMVYFEPWDWIISASTYRMEFSSLINVEDFRDTILALKFGETGYSFVMDHHGNAVIHPKLQGINIFDAEELPNQYLEDMLKRKMGKSVYFWKNPDESRARQKLVMFNYIPEYQWIVASSCYLEEIYRPLKTLRYVIFGIFILSLILTVPVIQKISASITTPLHELMERFETIRHGNYTARMPMESTDEVGLLAIYFNRFMDQLERYHTDLQAQIRERHLAQEAQKESQERYFLLMESAPDPIITYDTGGNTVYINPAFTRVFGWRPEECIGKKMDHFVPKENWRETEMMIRAIKNGNSINNVDTQRYAKDGNRVDVSISGATTRDRTGNPSGSIIIHRDIRKSKILEKQVLLAGDRERQKIGQDLHDDLCPHLIGTAGLATVIKEDLDREGHPNAPLGKKVVQLIEDAIQKTRTLARGLCPVHLVSHGLQNALKEILEAFQYMPGFNFHSDIDGTIVCDDNTVATHLYHIAREGVNNAVKHSEGDLICLSLRRIGDDIELAIKDNGKGISENESSRGMGLKIMAYRTKLINGRFEMESRADGFRVTVNIQQGETIS